MHIDSLPRMLPHYVKNSQKHFLDSKLGILKMYSLYKDFCKEKAVQPVRCHVYRKVFFCTEYLQIIFFTPKKDQCSTCAKYNSAKHDPLLKQSYETHSIRKEICYK